MSSRHGGTTAFERYRARLNDTQFVCDACGYVDDDGTWSAGTSGRTVVYRRQCRSCGAESVRDYRF
ncbi:HVO_0649 family zinc finger protein [Halorubrum luteum]